MKNNKHSAKKFVSETKSKINISPVLNLTPDQIQEAIRQKAYEIYVEGGYQDGKDAENWLTAERMVLETI